MSSISTTAGPNVGVLALQGAFARHVEAIEELGATAVEIRKPEQLNGLDGLIIPGGESTTMAKLMTAFDLVEPLAELLADGLPVFGTCAGMILLSSHIADGHDDQLCFGVLDLSVKRNGYGRQIDSFEIDLLVDEIGSQPIRAVFIRAPKVEKAGADVEVLAAIDDSPVLCRQGRALVTAFHPELTEDTRLHQLFLDTIRS